MEEERRLAYVGITRAEQKLYLTHCWQRTLYGTTRFNQASRFLEEIPGHLLTRQDPLDGDLMPETQTEIVPGGKGEAFSGDNDSVESISTLQAGDTVLHRKWGQGTVIKIRGAGEKAEVDVDFPGMGIKTLMVKFAPLRKISG